MVKSVTVIYPVWILKVSVFHEKIIIKALQINISILFKHDLFEISKSLNINFVVER